MARERKRKLRRWKIALVFLAGAGCVVFFLLSMRGILLDDAKDKLLELAGSPNNKETYFSGDVYRYLLDAQGNVLISYNTNGMQYIMENDSYLGKFLENQNKAEYHARLAKSKGVVERYKFFSGREVYIAVKATDMARNGYIVSVLDADVIDNEIKMIAKVALVIIVIAIFALLLALIYSIYHRSVKERYVRKRGKADSVTGLTNYMKHKSEAQIFVNQEKKSYAYVSFSIVEFGLILELSGKAYCDYILKNVASIMVKWLSEGELITRYHDDLFGMLLLYDDELEFRKRLLRMFKHAGDIERKDNNFCNITFRCGVCVVGKDKDMNHIFNNAIKAMNKPRTGTMAAIEFFIAASRSNSNEEKKVQKQVIDALKQEQFVIYLQPKYHLDSNKVAGTEALVRWEHPEKGLLSPSIFLPFLEEHGLITKIDYYVIGKVCDYIKQWEREGKQLVPVSINLSDKQFDSPMFVKEIIRIVDEKKVPHQLIELEFPESAIYNKLIELKHAMKTLQREGFLVSLDNFGVGVSAVHILKELPINILKIDKGLIKDYDDVEFSDKDRTIVMHIISIAKAMNVQVVAEGVETKGQKDMLAQQHCDMIQGYYYQKPMRPEAFEELLQGAT